jgi:radical SAM superfamily enzyme YgiQ (UPF0313 family)
MKFALVMPRSTFIEDPLVFQPLGLFYLAARLESLGHTTEFFDLNVDELPRDGEFDQLWVSTTSPQMMEARRIANETLGWKTKRILGGAGSWASPDAHIELPYDLIVSGESDSPESILMILDAVDNPPPDRHLTVPISRTLDWVLPPVRRWSRKYHSYLTDFEGVRRPCTTMFTSRGCPLECAFCESGRHGIIWDRLTRYEPLATVETQIKECYDLGYRALAYYDDILPLNKKRMFEILELHKKYGMVWRCFLRSDIINNHGGFEYMQAMAEGGLVEIFVGVESADNRIKEGITKKTTIEQDENIVKWCRELGIKCKLSFILGLPGESAESMETTRRWILAQNPEGLRIQLGRLIPFTGTPLTKSPENYDLKYETQIDENWFYRGKMDLDSHSFVSTSHLSVAEIDTFWRNLETELDEKGYSK